MQFVILMPRSGEQVPVNPLEVTSVRQRGGGGLTVVTMSTGQEVWVEATVEEVIDAIEAGANDSGAGPVSKRKPLGRAVGDTLPGLPPAVAAARPGGREADDPNADEAQAAGEGKAAHDDGEGRQRGGRR